MEFPYQGALHEEVEVQRGSRSSGSSKRRWRSPAKPTTPVWPSSWPTPCAPSGVRTFNVNDGFDGKSLRIEIDTSLTSLRAVQTLDELVELRGTPQSLCPGNGRFISVALRQWAERHNMELLHIRPGQPTQNAYIERFNRAFRTEVLGRYVFTSRHEVRRTAEDWRHRYSHQRPHRPLDRLSLVAYAMASSTTSTCG